MSPHGPAGRTGPAGARDPGRVGAAGADVLVVRAVTHRHRGATAPALTDVTLAAGPREVVAVAGRSGSGKSTLCHLVAGLASPDAGEVLVAGRPATAVDDWQVRSFLPQRLGVAEELTVAENVGLPRLVRGLPADGDLLRRLDLDGVSRQPATRTSLGEQQRTALARALALDPALLVLDEPTGHQDDDHVELVLAALDRARSQGTSILVATHDERVLAVADRVVRLVDGRLTGTRPGGVGRTDG